MHILNIAEKPSVAKSISRILSQTINTQRGKHKYCPNLSFKYNDDSFIFTSVLGHIENLSFVDKYLWENIDPKILFTEPLKKVILDDFLNLKKNIEDLTLKVDKAIIWTDCDREGEHIAKQISNIIKNKKNIEVKRARFSGISRNDIINALNNLVDINLKEADAVDCRMEMDLRIGSSFTILQTLAFKSLFNTKHVISFGPCQIPTLGFVVERYLQIEKFKEENFYALELIIKNDKWTWKRGNIFDKNCVAYFHKLLSNFKPIVVKKEVKPTSKMKPLPLRTVELQKLCSSIFKISSHKVMEISENLYNKGYISYPRTETDAFPKNFNFKTILDKLSSDRAYSSITEQISSDMKLPRQGKNNDMAHSPIYPLKSGNDLSNLDRSIYDFISRRFLGALCDDAKGFETYYECIINKEMFYIKGLKITERNYLEVYTFDKWADKEINDYDVNKEVLFFSLNMTQGLTTPPLFLTESELITLMDKNGIGTDATIHEHIQKIQERSYALKNKNYIIPHKLGIGLIKGYSLLEMKVGKPDLRRDLEESLKSICNGEVIKKDVLEREISLYKGLYSYLSDNIERVKRIIEETLNNRNDILDKFINSKWDDNKKKPKNSSDTTIKKDTNTKKDTTFKKDTNTKKDTTIKKDINTKNNDIDKENKDNKGDNKYKNEVLCKCGKPSLFSYVESTITYKCFTNPPRCNFYETEEVKCTCNYEPKVLMSFTENNKNRRFFKCKKSYKPCKFFKWAESGNVE